MVVCYVMAKIVGSGVQDKKAEPLRDGVQSTLRGGIFDHLPSEHIVSKFT